MALASRKSLSQDVASVLEKITTASECDQGGSIYATEEQKNALVEARGCIERLLLENIQLENDRDAVQEEARENEITKLLQDWKEETQFSANAAKKERADLCNQVINVQTELQSVKSYQDNKEKLEGELDKAKGEKVQLSKKNQNEMAELERKYIEQINCLKHNYQKRMEEIQRDLNTEIEERVGSKIRHILGENDQLNEEIRMHVEVTGSLQKEKADLQHEAATFSRDLVLLRQAEALHLQRGHNQARSIAESNNKVHNLEKSLGKLIRRYGSERRALEEDHQKSIVAFQAEKQMMRRLVQTKTKELKRIRQSAQQSLRERSEVEAFLIESLHYVTQQIRNTKKAASPRIGLSINESTSRKTLLQDPKQFSPSTLPHAPLSSLQFWPEASRKLGGKDYAVYRKKTYACDAKAKLQLKDQIEFDCLEQLNKIPVKLTQKVDISELTWTERENVLRYLFQKINNAHQLPQSELLSADKRDNYNFC
ncbi:hypothetical protein O6H91_11G031600 [Diphasiastrum complanatum]|uniref:Uncharacterized protein n=1 Tax=Diphasiastrum complanatum TaxID=34168 RepID=A0ACC2C7X1_DIPCM|nr:hypothetical protein O6H91_11G031600 [Diphasiastrum complanatum]